MEALLDERDRNQPFYADSAYAGEPQEKVKEKNLMENRVCEKGYRGHPLRDEQKANNKEKSHIRSRVEHICGFMENNMNAMYIQCIGIKRAKAIIGLMNLTYNMHRYGQFRALLGGVVCLYVNRESNKCI
jgi:IS5 family transposase